MIATATIFAAGILLGALGTATTEGHITMKSKIIGTTRRGRILRVAGLLALTASVAVASWLLNQAGSAGGQIGSLTPMTVSAGAANDSLYPGGDADAVVHITNPAGNGPLVLKSVSVGGSPAPTGFSGSCQESNVTVPDRSINIPVAAGADQDYTIPDAFHLSASAPNACQGLSFTRSLLLGAETP